MSEQDACEVLALNCDLIRGEMHTNTGMGNKLWTFRGLPHTPSEIVSVCWTYCIDTYQT